MNKHLLLLVSVVFILGLALVVSAAENAKPSATNGSAGAEKNMTYGQCVSKHADTKNTCYKGAETALKTCKEQTGQNATAKDAVKQCKQVYDKDKKQCKTSFKTDKNECKKIKHNVFESMGAAFK